jgi:transposase-like protein
LAKRPVCPNCGGSKHYETKKIARYRCAASDCRKDFTVQTKTVMERSHAPLTHWAYAFTGRRTARKAFQRTS